MNDVVIIGNSGAARECHQLLFDSIWASPSLRYLLNFKGFLSYRGFSGSLGALSDSFLGGMEDYPVSPRDRFIIGVGDPHLRRDIFLEMKDRGAQFMNLISPWSYVPGDFQMGEANIINSHCNFSGGSRIGDGNYFNGGVRLGHDVTLGSFNFFGPSSTALGGVTVGDANLVAVQSVLLEHCRIGSDNHIHPASIVFKGCRDKCRMAGNPALKIM